MRWFLAACILSFVPQTVYGSTLSEVLALYGASAEIEDTSQVEEQLSEAMESYHALRGQYDRDEFLKSVDEVARLQRRQDPDYDLKMDMNRRYLVSLVNVEADLETIFEAEAEYRALREEWAEVRSHRERAFLDMFELSGVSQSDVNSAADVVNEIQMRMGNATEHPDIGTLSNLKSPTSGVWAITSKFGYRTNPITKVGQEFHNGLDLGAAQGVDVLSLFGGKVLFAGNKGDGYGHCVLVSHANEFQTFYAHLESIAVKEGDMVSQYQKIGTVGSTGRSTGPHLHLGVFVNGRHVDPLRLFGGD